MSLEMPSELDWLFKLLAGQEWPKGDEDKLRELGRAWTEFSTSVQEISGEFEPMFNLVTSNLSGRPAESFQQFVTQMHKQLPAMVDAGKQVAKLSSQTAQQVEYSKYMIIGQLVLLAAELAWAAANAFWTFGASEAMTPAFIAATRLTVSMILRRLAMAILTGVVSQVALDVAIQTIQAIKAKLNGDDFSWNWSNTASAAEMGAIGGALGGGIGMGLNKFKTTGFGDTFGGKLLTGGATGVGMTEISNLMNGDDANLAYGLTSGMAGALGGGGRRGHGGGEPHMGDIHVDDVNTPKFDTGDFTKPNLSSDFTPPPETGGGTKFDTGGSNDFTTGNGNGFTGGHDDFTTGNGNGNHSGLEGLEGPPTNVRSETPPPSGSQNHDSGSPNNVPPPSENTGSQGAPPPVQHEEAAPPPPVQQTQDSTPPPQAPPRGSQGNTSATPPPSRTNTPPAQQTPPRGEGSQTPPPVAPHEQPPVQHNTETSTTPPQQIQTEHQAPPPVDHQQTPTAQTPPVEHQQTPPPHEVTPPPHEVTPPQHEVAPPPHQATPPAQHQAPPSTQHTPPPQEHVQAPPPVEQHQVSPPPVEQHGATPPVEQHQTPPEQHQAPPLEQHQSTPPPVQQHHDDTPQQHDNTAQNLGDGPRTVSITNGSDTGGPVRGPQEQPHTQQQEAVPPPMMGGGQQPHDAPSTDGNRGPSGGDRGVTTTPPPSRGANTPTPSSVPPSRGADRPVVDHTPNTTRTDSPKINTESGPKIDTGRPNPDTEHGNTPEHQPLTQQGPAPHESPTWNEPTPHEPTPHEPVTNVPTPHESLTDQPTPHGEPLVSKESPTPHENEAVPPPVPLGGDHHEAPSNSRGGNNTERGTTVDTGPKSRGGDRNDSTRPKGRTDGPPSTRPEERTQPPARPKTESEDHVTPKAAVPEPPRTHETPTPHETPLNRGHEGRPAPWWQRATEALSALTGPPTVTLDLGHHQIEAHDVGGMYKFTNHDVYISKHFLEEGADFRDQQEVIHQVDQFLGDGLTLHRGISSWHPKWHDVEGGEIPPLGTGDRPDFSTRDTRFVPFTADFDIAKGVALGNKGMDSSDDRQFVHGYDPNDPTQPVGKVLTKTFSAANGDSIAFLVSGETQIGGPIRGFTTTDYRMNTSQRDVFGPNSPDEPLSSIMPPKPTPEQIAKYVNDYHALRHDPTTQQQIPGRPAPHFDRGGESPAPHTGESTPTTHAGPKGPDHMSADEWNHHYNEGRNRAPHRTVNLDDPDVLRKVPRTHDDGRPAQLSKVDGKIHYDVRRMEVEPGRWVQEHTVKFHLEKGRGVDDTHLDGLKQRIQDGVDKAFNHQHKLPGSGDELHVRVEFHDDPATAHETIKVDHSGDLNQHRFPLDATGREFAHEVGHYLGLPDRYNDTAPHEGNPNRIAGKDDDVRVLNSDDGRRARDLDGGTHDLRNRIDDGSSPMGEALKDPNSRYQPKDIKGIEDVAHDHAALPDTSHDMFTGKQPVPDGLHVKENPPPRAENPTPHAEEPVPPSPAPGSGVGRSFASHVNDHLGTGHQSRDVWKQIADEVRSDPERYLPGADQKTRDDVANRIESGSNWGPQHVEVANKAVPHAFHTTNFDEHPVARGQGHDNGPATHEDRKGFFDKIKNAFTPPEHLDLGDGLTVNAHREGGFHKLDDHNVFISSHLIDGQDPRDAAIVYDQVKQYMGDGLTLYRGISAWHPTWQRVGGGEIPPLGSKAHPDFSTRDTKYVPFSADRDVALGAALGNTGMGRGDDRRFVHGYDPNDPAHPVGMVLTKKVSAASGDEIAFINSGETQLGGPIHDFDAKTYHMGDPVSAVFGGPDDGRTLGSVMPPKPDAHEIQDYTNEHGGLRHDPSVQTSRPAPVFNRGGDNAPEHRAPDHQPADHQPADHQPADHQPADHQAADHQAQHQHEEPPLRMPGSFDVEPVDTHHVEQPENRPMQSHEPNLDNIGLVESVLRSAAFQHVPLDHAAPLADRNGVRSTVDSVISKVAQEPERFNFEGLTPQGLSHWAAEHIDQRTLEQSARDLEPQQHGLSDEAKTRAWRDALANDLAAPSARRWQDVRAALGDHATPGDREVVDHVTKSVTEKGSLPTPAELVTKGLQTPSWNDSHVGKHLPDTVAHALDLHVVVDHNGEQTHHGPADGAHVEIQSHDGHYSALGEPNRAELRDGMEAWLGGRTPEQIGHTVSDLAHGRQDKGLYDLAQGMQKLKRAAAHPGGPQGFMHDLMDHAAHLDDRIRQLRSEGSWKPKSMQSHAERAAEAQRKTDIQHLDELLKHTNQQIDHLKANGPKVGVMHVLDKYVAGENANGLQRLGPNVLRELDEHLSRQISAAEKGGFDPSDLRRLQERVQNEPTVRKAWSQVLASGTDSLRSTLDQAKQAVEDYRLGFAERESLSHRLTHMFEPAEDLTPHREAMAEAQGVVKQLEHMLSLTEHDDYRDRFARAQRTYDGMRRLERVSENLAASRQRQEEMQRDRERRLAEERAAQEHDTDSDAGSHHEEPRELTPAEEHAAFKASLHGMSADELRAQADWWRGNPDREYEIERMSRYQAIMQKEGGLDQHLSDLRRQIDETHKQIGDLKRAADVLPDAFKTSAMRQDETQRREEQQRLIRHQRALSDELNQLEFNRVDALTAHAMHLPADPKAPGWQKLSHDDLAAIEDHVNDLMHDARLGGHPTDRLYGLYNQVRDLRIGDPTPEHTAVDAPAHEPTHNEPGHNELGHSENPHEPGPQPFMRPGPHTGTPGVDHLMPGSIGAVHEERSLRSFEASLYGLDHNSLSELRQTYAADPERSAAIQRMIDLDRHAGHTDVLDNQVRSVEKGLADAQARRDGQANPGPTANRWVQQHEERLAEVRNDRATALTMQALRHPDDPTAPAWQHMSDDDLKTVHDHAQQQIDRAREGGHPTEHLQKFVDFTGQLRSDRGYDDQHPAHEPEPAPAVEPRPQPFMRPGPSTRSEGVDMDMHVPGGFDLVHEGTPQRSFEASLYGLDHKSLTDLQQMHATDPERSAAIQKMIDLSRIASRPDLFDRRIRAAEESLADAKNLRDQRSAPSRLPEAFRSQAARDQQQARREADERQVQFLENRLAQLRSDREAAITLHALRQEDDPNGHSWRGYGDADLAAVHRHVQRQIDHAREGGHPTEHLQKFVDFTRQLGRDRGYDDLSTAHDDTSHHATVHEPEPAPVAQPRPQPFMRPEPSARSAAPDMDMHVPGGFGPVHEGTPLRSFEASLYGMDHNALHEMQQMHARDPERSAAIQKMMDATRHAGRPDIVDQRIRLVEDRLAEAKARRDRWTASDLVPDAVKSDSMREEQAARRAADDRDVRYLEDRLAQLRSERDTAITVQALRQEDDPTARSWRGYSDRDLQTVHDHVQQQIEHAREGGHPTEHLEKFVDFTQQLRESRAEHHPSPAPHGDGPMEHPPAAKDPSLASPEDWEHLRGHAPVGQANSERFDPGVKQHFQPGKPGSSGNHLLDGWMTRIGYESRRMEVSPGKWVREFTVRLDTKGEGVGPHEVQAVQDRVTKTINDHINGRYKLPNGDQLHIRPDFGTKDPVTGRTVHDGPVHGNVTVHNGDQTNQARWSTKASGSVLTHEVLHNLGLKDEYKDTGAIFRKNVDDAGVRGPMGRDVLTKAPELTPRHLKTIEDVARSSVVQHDLPLGSHGLPANARTGNHRDVADPWTTTSHGTPGHNATSEHHPAPMHEPGDDPAAIKSSVAAEHGVHLSDEGEHGVNAVRESNPNAPATELAKVKRRAFTADEVRGIQNALKHYAPITGDRRATSSRAHVEQEVRHFGAAGFGLENNKLSPGMGGEYIASHKTVNLYASGLLSKEFGAGSRSLEGTATHELSHGLLKYALEDYGKHIGSWDEDGRTPNRGPDAEPPSAPNIKSDDADFAAAIKSHLLGKAGFAQRAPKRSAFIDQLEHDHPEVFAKRDGELSGQRAKRIFEALGKDNQRAFNERTGYWDHDGFPKFQGERPITRYGATNLNEDMAETAKYYFLDPEKLRAEAPNRAAFFDKLVSDWTPQEQQHEGGTHAPSNAPSEHRPAPAPSNEPSNEPSEHRPAPAPTDVHEENQRRAMELHDRLEREHQAEEQRRQQELADQQRRAQEEAEQRRQQRVAEREQRQSEREPHPLRTRRFRPNLQPTPEDHPLEVQEHRQDVQPDPDAPRPVDEAQLASYVRDGQSLGLGRVVDAERLADDVVTSVHDQLPMTAAERRGLTGTDRIHHAITKNFGSVLGGGSKFEVKVNGRTYEATVKVTRLDFTGAQRTTVPKQTLDLAGSTARTAAASTTKTRTHDLSGSVTVSSAVGPGGTVSGKVVSARPTISLDSSAGVTQSHSLSHEGVDLVHAKVEFHVALTDAKGVPTHPAGHVEFRRDITLALPTDAVGTPPAHAAVTDVRPNHLNVFGVEAVSGVGGAFEHLSGDLHAKITEIGSPGRKELLNFLSADNIRSNLPSMAKDWIYSPDLVSSDGTRIGAVRMRIEPVGARLEGSVGGYKVNADTEGSATAGRGATTKSGFDISGTFGGAAAPHPVSKVSAGGGLTVGYTQRDSLASSLGDAAKWKSSLRTEGTTGLYNMGFRLHVQAIGHDVHTIGGASAHIRMSDIEAGHAGLQVPDGGHGDFEATPQRHYAPEYLESGKSIGLGSVFHLSGTDGIRDHVENALRGNETLRDLAPEFGSDRLAGRSRSDIAEAMNNRRLLDTHLSHENLSSNLNSMLAGGMKFRLKQPGLGRNHYVTVTVKATMGPLDHLGKAANHQVRGSGSSKAKLSVSDTAQKGGSVSLDGRVNTPVTDSRAVTTPTTSAGARYGYTRTWKTDTGPEIGDKLGTSGETTAHAFRSNLRYEVTIEEHSRNRSWVRRITPGLPGNHVPEVHRGAPHHIDGQVTVLVPESLTSHTQPTAHVDRHVTTPEPAPRSITQLRQDAGLRRPPEFQRVEAVIGAEHIHAAAVDALREAAGGDEALSLSGRVSADELHHAFSPEVLEGDPQVIRRGLQVDGLQYNRRIADRVGAVGMTMELGNPRIVAVSDDISLTHTQTGGYTVTGSKQTDHSLDLTVGEAVAARPNVTPAHGSATFSASSTLRGWTWSAKTSHSLGGSVEHGVTSGSGRTVLVKMDAIAHVVAESRQNNVLHNTEVRTAGRTVTLPDSVFVRVTEQQARTMGLLPEHGLDAQPPAPRPVLPAPTTLSGRHPSVGFGHVEPTGDLTALVPSLRRNLGELGGKLLPESVLDDSMGNLRRIGTQSSQEGVRSLVDSALNGGVSLLAPKANTFSHDTYEVVLHATPTGAPTYLGVTHDGTTLSHESTSTTNDATTTGREANSGLAGRFTGTGMPKTQDKSVSAALPNSVGASITRTTGSKITHTDTVSTTQSSSASGPQARYRLPVDFHLEIRRNGVEIGRSAVDPHELVVRKLADDVSTAGDHATGGPSVFRPLGADDVRPEQVRQWQRDGEQLPAEVHVDDFTGDIRELRTQAHALTGDLRPARGHALDTALTPEVIKANLPAMLKGPVELPGLKDTGLTAYAKLTNPRLVAVSDSVDVGGATSHSSKIDTEVSRSVTGSVNTTLAGGGGGVRDNPATPEHHRDVNANVGGLDVKRSGLDSTRTFASTGDTHPAPPATTATSDRRSKVLVYDTEIRFQKDGRGASLVFKDGARIRMADDGALPDTVRQAQDRVKTTEQAWKDAEKDLLTARHKIDDAYLAARQEIADRRAELAQVRQNEAVHLNNTTALRNDMWDAGVRGDQAEMRRLQGQLDQAHQRGEELTRERQEIERRIDELQQPQRDAQREAQQAHQAARTAEDAWWDARRARDNAIADVNRPPAEDDPNRLAPAHDSDNDPNRPAPGHGNDTDRNRPAPTHGNGVQPNRGQDYNPAAHDQHKPVIDDESWRHSQERTAPWFAPERPMHPSQWEHLRRDDLARTVHTEIADVKTSSRIGANGRPRFERYTGLVRYDLRRIEVEPGRFVQEHTVKLHLDGDPEQVAKAKADARRAVDEMLNKGYRLPSGDQFHLRLEFPDDAKDAHSTVHVGDKATDQTHWKAGENPNVLAHEVLHYLGPGDEYRDPSRVFLDDGRKSAVHDDNGLLGGQVRGGAVELKPRNLWHVERVSHDQVAVPDTRLGHDYDGLNLGRENPRVERPADEPTRPTHDSDDESMSVDSGSDHVQHDQEHDWGLGEQRRHEEPSEQDVAARGDMARTIGAALGPDHHNVPELFNQLHRNGRDDRSVRALDQAFRLAHDTSLAEALTSAHEHGRLSDDEYQQALHLLGHGNTMFADPAHDVRVTSTAGARPSANPSVVAVATAMRGHLDSGRHEEALALLGGINRDPRATWAVHDAYRDMYHSDLDADLHHRMPAAHQAFLDHLLGGVSNRAVPLRVADRWFGELERATFPHEFLGDLPIPTGHPEDGCYLRAHLWALRLKQLGAPVQKIFVARTGPLLSIQSATAAGATREHPVEVNWGYHVAPVVRVHDEAGHESWAVFDPAMRGGLMSAQDWLARTGVTGIEPIHAPLPDISAMLLQNSVDHPEWWTPEGTQRLPLGAVSVITDVHAYGFPHPGNGFPDGIRTTDNAVRDQEHLMVDHTFADMERQLQRGVLDVLDRGLSQDETVAELRRLADGNPQALGFLEREQNLDHSMRLLMALPDRLGELNGIFPALFDPALLHGSDDWLADLLGPTPAEAVLPHTGAAEQHAPADFDFSQWLSEQAIAQPAHDGFDYQGWAQHFAATEPPTGSGGAGPSHHADALDPADHTGPALGDDFDFDAFLRGQINLDGTPVHHRPAPPEHQEPEHHEEVETRPAPPELSPHLLEPIPDLSTSHAAVDADGLAATLAGHGAHEETSRLVVDAAKDAVDATRSLEGEEAAGRFAAAMPHAMRLLEKAGAVTTLLRQAGDAVTAGLTLSHVMEGVARAWAQGGNAAAAAAVAQDMKRLGLAFAEVNTEGIEADAH